MSRRRRESFSDMDTSDSHERWTRAVAKTKKPDPLVRSSSQQLLKDLREGQDLKQWDPELCVQMLRMPTVQNYSAIAKLLEKADEEWMLEFLERDGLGMLLECLILLGEHRAPSVADTLTQIQCVACLRAVMNFDPALDYVVDHPNYARQLARNLISSNPTLKLQVYELLSVVSWSSPQGHIVALDALDHLKEYHGFRYRFEVIITEIKTTESDLLRSRVLALVNCLIMGSKDIHERDQLRSEFLGVGLGAILSDMDVEEDLLHIQRDAFYKHMHEDQTELERDPSSTPDVLFKEVYTKVAGSPMAYHFISMLRNLSKIDSSKSATDQVWKLLNRISAEGCALSDDNLMVEMDFRYLTVTKPTISKSTQTPLKSYPIGKFAKSTTDAGTQVDSSELTQEDSNTPLEQTGAESTLPSVQSESISLVSPPPPPPLPESVKFTQQSPPPPPPPLPLLLSGHASASGPPPPPPPPLFNLSYPSGYNTLPNMRSLQSNDVSNKYNTWHGPRRKMKTVNWTKIPKSAIGNSIWSSVDALPTLDTGVFEKMEELFCQASITSTAKPLIRKKSITEVTLLDEKRSLSVNVFLRRVGGGGQTLINAVKNVSSGDLDADTLQNFQKLLPQKQELELISSNISKLQQFGPAEKFFHQLSQIPSFSLKVEAMHQKGVFTTKLQDLRPQIEKVVQVCSKLIENKSLGGFLALVLQLGNALNFGSYAGNAVGFKLTALPKLMETQSNKGRVTFLHYIVDVAQSRNKEALAFATELSDVKSVSRIAVEHIEEEVKTLARDVKSLKERIAKDKNIPSDFKDFMKQAHLEAKELEKSVKSMKKAIVQLAQHFCESPDKFNPEECFKLLTDFFIKVKKAQMDNEERQKREERSVRMKINKNGKSKAILEEDSESLANRIHKLMSEICQGGFQLKHVEP